MICFIHSLPVKNLKASARIYDAAMDALGYRRVCEFPDAIGYGSEEGKDKLLICQYKEVKSAGKGFHLAFQAHSREEVNQFHQNATKQGATDNGPPGLRKYYGPNYYAAFIIDPDGHRIEAVFKS